MDWNTLLQTTQDTVILPGARVSGDVVFSPGCSVWYNAVIRADESYIRVGPDTNIQDNVVCHTSHHYPLVLGAGVSVGHSAILHGCTVGDNTLIGMGSIILDGAVIGQDCIIGAGSLVTGGTVIPDGSMVLGRPGKVVRPLRSEEIEGNRAANKNYLKLKENYR